MKSRAAMATLFLGAALVLSSAQSASAFFGCLNRGGGCCGPSCCEPVCCEPTCGCDYNHGCCDTGRRGGCLNRLFGGLRRGHGHGCCDVSCCEPSCCAAEPSCCAPEPSCCAAEPSCGCEADCCCEPCCRPRCRILGRFGGLLNRGGRSGHHHGGCCEPSCACL